ncbi:MAG: hypothetical protein BA863_10345 [Desulfovibrio sp. S3730MH75]|nr:MAG: hypothetical protein BA863_10345 [Desulfovibrio sp. S3730MH75]
MKNEHISMSLNVSEIGPASLLGTVVKGLDQLQDQGVGSVDVILKGGLSNVDGGFAQMNLVSDNLKELAAWLKQRETRRMAVINVFFVAD